MENNKLQTTNESLNDKQLIGYLDTMGLAAKLTEKEKTQFLEISKAFGLNPFKREIYCSKYGEGQYAVMSIIVGYETYIKRAERSGQLDGWNVITDGKVEDGTLKATITIHRKDRKVPFVHEVYYSEYVQRKKDGTVNSFWQKAYTMTKKVAIAQGFRLCFSDEMGGMPYTADEMPDVTQDIAHVDVTPTPITLIIEDVVDQVEDAKAILITATPTTLNNLFKSLPANMQKNEDVISYAATIKASFKQ